MTTTPSPFELGAAIGGNISGGINRGLEDIRINKILREAQSSGSPEVMNNAMNQILMTASPENRQGALQVLQARQNQMQREAQKQAYQSQGLSPELANLDPSVQKQFVAQQAAKNATEKKSGYSDPETQKRVDTSIKRQMEILKGGRTGTPGLGWLKRGLSSRTREDRSEFDTLSGAIESALLPEVSKGPLAKQRFNYLMSLLPKSSDTNATLRGKFKALARDFNLPEPNFDDIQEISPEKREESRVDKDFAEFWE